MLLPPALQDWLPEGHLALFLSDGVDHARDLSPILAAYETGDGRGQPPYHPALMVKRLLYADCTGKPSSRQIEPATYEEVPYRVLAANQHPDHDSLTAFRQQHLPALAGRFLQVLTLCQQAGLVKLGHVALDGTTVLANASTPQAMRDGRMRAAEQQLEAEVAALLAPAQPKRAERDRQAERTGRKPPGRPPQIPDPTQATPKPKAQRNFTDPASRIMKDGATTGFVPVSNAQAAVDGHAQGIGAADVPQEANAQRQVGPMLTPVTTIGGGAPAVASADSGYCRAAAVTDPALAAIDLYVAVERQQHGAAPVRAHPAPDAGTAIGAMRAKRQTAAGHAVSALCNGIVEPVCGQITGGRGCRRFSFRGLGKVRAEWLLMCLTHNLLKLFRAGWTPQPACAARKDPARRRARNPCGSQLAR